MAATVKSLMNIWGRNFLREQGHEVADDAEISFDTRTEWSGGCETCNFDYEVVDISDGKVTENWGGTFSDLLYTMNNDAEENEDD